MADQIGVAVGRFQPLHNGHLRTITTMKQEMGIERSIVLIGSMQEFLTPRNPFPYRIRYHWMKSAFPLMKVIGIADVPHSDLQWFYYILDLLHLNWDGYIEPIFFGGADEDLSVFKKFGAKTRVIQRQTISGTMIREKLLSKEDVSGYVPGHVAVGLSEAFDLSTSVNIVNTAQFKPQLLKGDQTSWKQ